MPIWLLWFFVPFGGQLVLPIFLSSIFLSAFGVFGVFRGFNSGFLGCGCAALRSSRSRGYHFLSPIREIREIRG